jgi:hypothetical protein
VTAPTVVQVAATRSAGVLDLRSDRSRPLPPLPVVVPGLSVADGLYSELTNGGPVTELAAAVRACLPGGRVTRRAVSEALQLSGSTP